MAAQERTKEGCVEPPCGILQEETVTHSTVPGRPALLACGARSAPWKTRVKRAEKVNFLRQLFPRFLLPRNSPGDINQTRANCLVLHPSPIAGRGSRGTKPKRRLWRMKRGVVLNRNEHSSGSEKATIEVAERLSPGSGGPQRPENLPVADFQRGRAGRPRNWGPKRSPTLPLWRMNRGVILNRNEHATGKAQASIAVTNFVSHYKPALPRNTVTCFCFG